MTTRPPSDDLHGVADRLTRRFGHVASEAEIAAELDGALARLSGNRVRSYVPVLAERMAADRLRALARRRGRDVHRPVIAYLCVHNAGRSQMAAAWTRHLAGDAVEVLTGGSDPAGEVNPVAVAAMAEVGVDLSGERPRRWTPELLEAADVVVTMGCGETCPVVPGARYEDWPVPDPAGAPLERVRDIRDEIGRRVVALLEDLGVAIAPGVSRPGTSA